MIANYTDHAANERTFLAWVRTGLAVAAFGFFLVKLNVLFDAIGGGSPPHPAADNAGFERTRRAINRDEVIQMPQSRAESLLSVALAIAVAIFCIYLAVL